MGMLQRLLPGLFSEVTTRAMSAAITPPPRGADNWVGHESAVTLVSVYRALDILTTSVSQLSIDVERDGRQLPYAQQHSIIRNPSAWMDRTTFFEQLIMGLGTAGNAYARKVYAGSAVVDLELWNPHFVGVGKDERTGRPVYTYNGTKYAAADVMHIAKMKMPGQHKGLGPIQAAQAELRSSLNVRDFGAGWFADTGQPNGVLSTDQALTADDAAKYRNAWNQLDDNGEPIDQTANPSGIKVMGKGLSYEPIMLKPADALWLEAQQFNTTQVARLFGVPASLMLAAVEGNAQTYSNVEQDWLAFTRFTLMGYLRKIEDAFSELLPRGQRARFNVESLLRADTASRYAAHSVAHNRWMTTNEIREIEGMPALDGAQLAELEDKPAGQLPAAEPAKAGKP